MVWPVGLVVELVVGVVEIAVVVVSVEGGSMVLAVDLQELLETEKIVKAEAIARVDSSLILLVVLFEYEYVVNLLL